MNAQQLKNSILQMAVQGKLVPQDPNDEPASVLLERIRAEKEKLIKEGKIKKEKNPSYIFRGEDNLPYEKIGKNEPVCIADEVPFEIPDSWEWVRLGEVFQHNTGKALNASNQSGELLEYITTSNLYWNRFELDSLRKMFFTESEVEKCTASKGDLLVCEGGDIGRAAIWNYDYDIRIQNHIHRLRAYIDICTEFFYYLFYLYKNVGWIGGKGIGIQGLSSNALHNILFPLPPLNEQRRIVNHIQKIQPYTDKYEEAYVRINTLNSSFAELLKKSILQRAVMGKLVPQDPNDEPASVLLDRICSEKQELIKAGTLKKDKHESIIFRRDNSHYEKLDGVERCIDDEIPFDIPDSWEWQRVSHVFNTSSGTTPLKSNSQYYSMPKFNWVRTTDLNNSTLCSCEIKISQKAFDECRLEIIPRKSVCIAMYGGAGTIGKNAYIDFDTTINQSVCAIHYNPLMNMEYVHAYIKYLRPYWMEYASGSRKDPNINQVIIKNMLIPIPPIDEQKRIVEKLHQLEHSLERCVF